MSEGLIPKPHAISVVLSNFLCIINCGRVGGDEVSS